MNDTIVAIATPYGYSAISVIRVSGDSALPIGKKLFSVDKLEPRRAHYLLLRDPESGKVLDDVIVIYYRAPRSYTGEDMLEIFAHGNPLIAQRIVDIIISLGARQAERGEFTKRAFLHGKMDLLQAATINNIINARSEQAIYALRSRVEGHLSRKLANLREQLLDLLKEIEARIDFEDDVPEIPREEINRRLDGVINLLESMIRDARPMEKVVEGISIVILGKVNVGKSSVFNKLLGFDRAIVSSMEGTTRDYISENLQMGGFMFRVIDTAGIRETEDYIERMGIEKSLELKESSDIILFVVSAEGMDGRERELISRLPPSRTIVVINKSDLREPDFSIEGFRSIRVSARTGEGFDRLKEEILRIAGEMFSGDFYFSTGELNLLREALQQLKTARQMEEFPIDMVTYHIRAAALSIASILGIEDLPEEVLDRVFRDFCIGK